MVDGCPILGFFSPAVLGSGEGDREWVLAITDDLLGTEMREEVLLLLRLGRRVLLRIYEQHRGRWAAGWPRPPSIFAPSGDANAIDYSRPGRDSLLSSNSVTNKKFNNNVANHAIY